MIQRTIKFRAWIKHEEGDRMIPHEAIDYSFLNKGWDEDFTLMQFTGLLDKNGKEIYEGDVVKCQYDTSRAEVVRFGDYMAGGLDDYASLAYGFYVQRDEKDEDDTETLSNAVEVIGNIYSNPALLGSLPT